MARVRVREVRHLAGAAEALKAVPQEVLDTLYEQLNDYVGQELETGRHVQRVVVEGQALNVSLFVDTDGTLWTQSLETTA